VREDGVWWHDVLKTMLWLGYGVSAADATFGPSRATINVAAVNAAGCPIKRNASSGVMGDARRFLRHVRVETSPAVRVDVVGGPQLQLNASQLTPLQVGAWSSSFWAASILESRAAYDAELAAEALGLGLLERAKAASPPSLPSVGSAVVTKEEGEMYLLDGGVVDTTGIVQLLQRGTQRILALYNNNDALAVAGSEPQAETASLAYLFGVAVRTDTMNSLAGPSLLQVFPSALFAPVLANLTDKRLLFARLSGVPVLRNDYLGVGAGRVDELLIFSNGRSTDFLRSFADQRIARAVSPEFPDRMPTGVPPLEANLLCQLQRWKLRQHADALRRFFDSTTQARV